jgi:hypothetical protein
MKHLFALLFILASAPAFATAPTTVTATNLSETATTFDATAVDATNGNQIANNSGNLLLVIHDADASNACTATVTAQTTSVKVSGFGTMTKANLTIALTAGQTKAVGPLQSAPWNDGNGYVQVTYSGTGCSSTKVNAVTAVP